MYLSEKKTKCGGCQNVAWENVSVNFMVARQSRGVSITNLK